MSLTPLALRATGLRYSEKHTVLFIEKFAEILQIFLHPFQRQGRSGGHTPVTFNPCQI